MLEGSYLRCGLVSDVMLMDGYPSKYTSFMNRLSRWIRGDWQITKWLGNKSPLNLLSKYKIFDNLRRSLFEISIIVGLIYAKIIKLAYKINTTEITSILIIILLIFPSFQGKRPKRMKKMSIRFTGKSRKRFLVLFEKICRAARQSVRT